MTDWEGKRRALVVAIAHCMEVGIGRKKGGRRPSVSTLPSGVARRAHHAR